MCPIELTVENVTHFFEFFHFILIKGHLEKFCLLFFLNYIISFQIENYKMAWFSLHDLGVLFPLSLNSVLMWI
ncbi:hypothetical protein L6452_18645 [Arctium lappa]|uniref:Uncharacterized protein n=1 Tax=Arctium lappa TaxID=4217 RepID=A0ACB9C725_ARCLA|nr:hypothetical protein L6452_18645 [Arctium lappa]